MTELTARQRTPPWISVGLTVGCVVGRWSQRESRERGRGREHTVQNTGASAAGCPSAIQDLILHPEFH